MELDRICENCRYWDKENDDEGICRRFPPDGETDLFPVTGSTDWCGEFRSNDLSRAILSMQ